ncbi:MAG: BatD family protein [Bacteroidaceae bacterium]|nr:BatD family protein [Bacteroidaceae bacterium]
MKTILCTFLALFFVGLASADKKPTDNITLFAVASLPQGVEEVYLDDSVIVTVTLYANVNFDKIDNKSDKIPTIKKSTVHRYNAGRRLTQDIAAYKGKRYYAVRAEQYAVTPSALGEITFPALQYNVVLSVQEKQQANPFDPFSDFWGFGRTQTKKVQKNCTSEPLKIKVSKRPRKTIEELRKSGATVM